MAFQKLTPVFKLVKVAQRRKRGDVTNVANQTGFTPSYVSRVLGGTRFNDTITNTAYRMTIRRETAQEKLSQVA